MLEVRDLHAGHPGTPVLAGVDVDVGLTEILGVLGASGSGKTTLLRVVAGLHRPDRGSVSWEGRDLAGIPTHERRFGMVFQDFALFPHLDVGRNVAFGVPDRDETVARTELERVGLGGLERRKVSELSGGQAQRVAVARALAASPRLLLLDEPLGSLDRALRRRLAVDLRRALHSAGIPAIHVTHDPDEAFAVSDRIAILDAGRVIRHGTPDRVWAAPGTEAAARLIGLTTIIDVTVDREGVHLGPGDGRPARAIVRSERVHISPEGPVTGIVDDTVFRGPGHLLTVTISGGSIEVPSEHRVEPGQTVRLEVPPEALTLLDG